MLVRTLIASTAERVPPFSRDFGDGLDCAAHHFTAATGVNREQRNPEFRGRTCGAGDLVRDVVKLQVEKHF